jgi:uncharacterized protein (TIGR02145 family)
VNLCLQSENINVSWSTTGGNALPTQSTEATPDGDTSNKYIKLADDGAGGTGLVSVRQSINVLANTQYTASVFLKADGLSFAQFEIRNYDGATDGTQFFGLSGDGSLGAASNLDDSNIKAYPNGWYRCSVTWTQGVSSTSFTLYIRVANSISSTTVDRDGTSSIFVWGSQVEESPIATSYIPTTTGAVTRLKDDISFTNASSVIGQSEGTLFVEVDWRGESVQNQHLLEVSDGTASNRIIILNLVSTDELRMFAQSNGSIETSQGESSTVYSGIQKIAFAYKQNDCELYRNGSSVSTDTTVDLSSLATLTDVEFQQGSVGNNQANMWIRDARIYNTRLSGAECLTLTGADLSDPYAPINGNEFEWNGFTYKVIVKNGLAWLDRNLGATRAATSSTDSQAYGDLYQWGRLTDGHEKRNSGTTSTLSTTDVPPHDDFIVAPSSPFDWRNPQNDNLWQGVNGINNPAPLGWRIPTESEWQAEIQSWGSNNAAGAFGSELKIPVAGLRNHEVGAIVQVGLYGRYWSSTVDGSDGVQLRFDNSSADMSDFRRASGYSVRCVRDIP